MKPPRFGMTLVLLIVACASAPVATSGTNSTTAPTPTSTSVVESSTTTNSAEPVVDHPQAPPPIPLLISGPAGIAVLNTDGSAEVVLDSPVVIAVDDTEGGVVYQVDSGRYSSDPSGTIVWWIRPGAASSEELLVPSTGHSLSLHDVYRSGDEPTALYTRFEGSGHDMQDTLRTFGLETRTVTQIASFGTYEAEDGPFSIGGDLIAYS